MDCNTIKTLVTIGLGGDDMELPDMENELKRRAEYWDKVFEMLKPATTKPKPLTPTEVVDELLKDLGIAVKDETGGNIK